MRPKMGRSIDDQPVIPRLEDFDIHSGWRLEQVFFNHRCIVVGICFLLTLALGIAASKLRLNASFEKTIPIHHPYIVNYVNHKTDLAILGNAIRVIVETKGTIYDAKYLATLQKVSDELFLMPGAFRPAVKSLFTANVQWHAVTDEGFQAGSVVPSNYGGTPEEIAQIRRNVQMSGELGQIVAMDGQSSIVFVPLLAKDEQGKPLDYGKLSEQLEAIRNKYQNSDITIRITGFAKVLGDLIGALRWFPSYFGGTLFLAAALLAYYTRSWRATFVVIFCSLIAVVWQLGCLTLMHLELDPYSILVPFLIFLIGASLGFQKVNGILQDVGRGTHKVVAARYTFRRLFVTGLTALLAVCAGFASLALIRIPVIQELALTASIGVTVLIITNLILVPILLSYVGVSRKAAERRLRTEVAEETGGSRNPVWEFLGRFTQPKWAAAALIVAVVITGLGLYVGRGLKIGDLDPGAPELRPNSRYNRDIAYLNAHYGASSDVMAVMVETPQDRCSQYDVVRRLDTLEWKLQQIPIVESTSSLALMDRRSQIGTNEGSLKWYDLARNQEALNDISGNAPGGLNQTCSLLTLAVFLKDHKADTLSSAVKEVQEFSDQYSTPEARILLGAGTGIDAATNIVVKKAQSEILYCAYAAVFILCLIAFRSVRAAIAAVLPLVMTTVLCQALMTKMGMGVKVATLPVIALGVGIGATYTIYLLRVTMSRLRQGKDLAQAHRAALKVSGRVVLFTGLALSIGIATWILSSIKYQSDTGILLSFMFLWNIFGALVLLPAICVFLLPRKAALDTGSHQPGGGEKLQESGVFAR